MQAAAVEEVRPERARLDRGHLDTQRLQLMFHSVRQTLDGKLGRAVNPPARPGDETADRGQVDDEARSLGTHLGQHRPRHGEQAEDVYVEHRTCLRVRGLLDGAHQTTTGVVHQGVDPAECRHCGVDRRHDLLGSMHIEFDGEQAFVVFREHLGEGLQVTRGGHDAVAAAESRSRDCQAESTRCPRDEPDGHDVPFVLLLTWKSTQRGRLCDSGFPALLFLGLPDLVSAARTAARR